MYTLTKFLESRADESGTLPAIHYGEQSISFAELDDRARRVAAGLRDLGVGPGDRVAVWLPNVPAYMAIYFACARLGAILVSVNTRYRAGEVADIVGRSGAKVLALWPDFKSIAFADILDRVPRKALAKLEHMVVYGEPAIDVDTLDGKPVVAYADLKASAPMAEDWATPLSGIVIYTTSGTTSAPKFVLHNQTGMVQHAEEVAAAFCLDAPDTRLLQIVPFCGTFGLSQAMVGLAASRPMYLMSSFDPQIAAGIMKAEAITHTFGADDMYDRLLASSDEAIPFPTLKFAGCGQFNSELEDIWERAEARGMCLIGLYGMSEVQALYAWRAPTLPIAVRKLGGGALVSPTAKVRVRDVESGELLPPGKDGELEISGPSLMAEYFGARDVTVETITDDGYVRSGDLARLEENGGFEYLARMGDTLRLGGFLVAPAEIESHLVRHADVEAAQAVGVAAGGVQRVVAFVIPAAETGIDEQALITHCHGDLARFKVPVRIFAIDAFPVTESANGVKIQRAKLRTMAEDRLASGSAQQTAVGS